MASTNRDSKKSSWEKFKRIAAEEPHEVDSALSEVAEALGTMADSLTNLRENLDLIEAPKSASIRVRIATKKKYASRLRKMAEEAPEVVADAIAEVYHSLDDVAGALESLSENLGIDLNLSPAEEAFAEEGIEESEGEIPEEEFEAPEIEEEEGEEEMKEASRKQAGPIMEKFTPVNQGLSETGALGALRKVLYSLDGSENKHQILGLVEEALNKVPEGKSHFMASRKRAGEFFEKMTPVDQSLTETGPLGALRKVLYSLDGSENKHQILGLVEEALNKVPEGKMSSKKQAGEFMEKFTPVDQGLSETGAIGALRKLLYTLDGSENKHQILGLVKDTLNKVARTQKKSNAAFVTDRDDKGEPKPTEVVDIPQSKSAAKAAKLAEKRAAVRQRIAKRHGITL